MRTKGILSAHRALCPRPELLSALSRLISWVRLWLLVTTLRGYPLFSKNDAISLDLAWMRLNPRKWHRSLRTEDILEISHERALGNSRRGHRAQCADKIPLVLTYHPKNQEVQKILLKNFRILSDDPTTKEIFNTKPLCVYRQDTSLRDILVHSTLSSRADDIQATPAGTFPCHRPRCRTCDSTGRTDRFGEHLRSVEGFKQNPRYQGGGFPVGEHFNRPEHNQVLDMRVSVVRQVEGGMAT